MTSYSLAIRTPFPTISGLDETFVNIQVDCEVCVGGEMFPSVCVFSSVLVDETCLATIGIFFFYQCFSLLFFFWTTPSDASSHTAFADLVLFSSSLFLTKPAVSFSKHDVSTGLPLSFFKSAIFKLGQPGRNVVLWKLTAGVVRKRGSHGYPARDHSEFFLSGFCVVSGSSLLLVLACFLCVVISRSSLPLRCSICLTRCSSLIHDSSLPFSSLSWCKRNESFLAHSTRQIKMAA